MAGPHSLVLPSRPAVDDREQPHTPLLLHFRNAAKEEDDAEALRARRNSSVRSPSWRRIPAKEQLSLLFLASFADYYQMASMHTYMIHQIRSFDSSQSDTAISRKAGILLGSCSAATVATAILWGRAADFPSIGRRGVIIIGLLCSGISSIGIGFSGSFMTLLLWSFLGGMLNGIPQSVKAAAVESVGEEYQSRAVLIQPAAFFLANTVGPVITGLLADPYATWPSLFAVRSSINNPFQWIECHPFAPPAVASAVLSFIVALLVAKLFRETLAASLERPEQRYTAPRALKPLSSWLSGTTSGVPRVSDDDQLHGLLEGQKEEDASSVSSPTYGPFIPESRLLEKLEEPTCNLSPKLSLALISVAILDFHLGAFNNLWLLLLSSSRSGAPSITNHGATSIQIDGVHFTGGLQFTLSNIGLTLSIIGLLGTTFQLLFYPRLQARLGLVQLFRLALFLFPIAYILAPYIVLLPSTSLPPDPASGFWVWTGIVGVLSVQVMARAATLPATTLLLKDSAGSLPLGTVYGIGQCISSLFRSIGPVAAGYLFAAGVQVGILGLAFWTVAGISLVGCLVGLFLKARGGMR